MIIGEETAYADIRILKRREKVKQKRHFIVSTLELQIDFQIFQNKKKVQYLLNRRLRIQTRNGPNGSGRRRWPTAGVNLGDGWNKKATKKGHGRHTLMPEAHSNVASLSVALNAKKMLWLTALTLYPGGLRTRNCTGSAGGRGPASGLELVRILLKRWLHRRFDALSQCGEM